MKKVKCLHGDCIIYSKIDIKPLKIVPLEGTNKSLEKLFSYFLYLAPDIKSSHSKKIAKDKHAEIFERMMFNRHFKYKKFCAFNAVIEDELSKAYLNDNAICLKCKRFVCKKAKVTKKDKIQETDLDCFLRHIRNSIAHGRVYLEHRNNKIVIIFEDENDSKKLSARIACVKSDLEYWKSILKKYA